MIFSKSLFILVFSFAMLMAACTPPALPPTPGNETAAPAGMSNPSSAFCDGNGGRSEIRHYADGSGYGVCVFDDGSECEEWTFYAGNCKPGQQQAAHPIPDDTLITLERTQCYGVCPIYQITIDATGKVKYEGIDYVRVKGKRESQIDRERVWELLEAFRKRGYFEMSNSYKKYTVTDMPSAVTSLTMNGNTKRIDHYYGDNSAPQALVGLERLIDDIAKSAQWVK